MNHPAKSRKVEYVNYQGKPVLKEHFRAFVYNASGKIVAENWDKYCKLIDSGEWFESPEAIHKPKQKKAKSNGPDSERVCS